MFLGEIEEILDVIEPTQFKKIEGPFLSRYPSVYPVLIFRYSVFSEAIFILHYYFS